MKKIPLLLLIGLLYVGPARAFTVEHDFTVILGPFNASKTRFTYALTPDSYAVNSTVKTDGMFNTLYPFKANYATTGKIVNGNLETTDYHYVSINVPKNWFTTTTVCPCTASAAKTTKPKK